MDPPPSGLLSLDSIQNDGDYVVNLLVDFLFSGSDEATSAPNSAFKPTVVFLPSSLATVDNVPGTRGLYSIPLGWIKRETVNNVTSFSVTQQRVLSDQFIDFEQVLHQWSILTKIKWFNDYVIKDGDLISGYSLSDFTFSVNSGTIILPDKEIKVDSLMFQPQSNDPVYIYLNYNPDNDEAYLDNSPSALTYFSKETGYNFFIGKVEYFQNIWGMKITQYMHDPVYFGGDTFKVKTISADVEPAYLSSKFEFQEVDENDLLTGYTDTFIGARLLSTAVPELSGNSYKIEPIWAYKEIQDYDPALTQAIITSGGGLKWDNKEIYKVLSNSSDTKPGFLYDELYQNSKSIKVSTFTNYDDNILVKLDVKPSYFTSLNHSITITPDGEDSLDFGFQLNEGRCIEITKGQGSFTIGVDKSCVFSDFSISGAYPIIVTGSRMSWGIAFDDSQFVKSITSQDGSVSISRDGTTVDLSVPPSGVGKVKIDANDTLDYLGTKFESNDLINFSIGNKVSAELGGDSIVSNGSIDVNITNGFATIDVDWSSVVIDQSLAPLISKSVSGTTMILSLNAPSDGKYVLMSNDGSVGWVAVGQCPGEEEPEQGQGEE